MSDLANRIVQKMADERAAITGDKQFIPQGCRWSDLANRAIEGVRLGERGRAGHQE